MKHDEVNVFENFLNNPLFLVILVGTIIIQLTMVKYGGKSLKTVELSFNENLLCIILGTFSLLSGLMIKIFLPENLIVCPYGIEFGGFKYYWGAPPADSDDKEEWSYYCIESSYYIISFKKIGSLLNNRNYIILIFLLDL